MPDMSVVIPSYQKATHLKRNLFSLSVQTLDHDRFEALVIDDGSTDDTKRIVDDARRRYDFPLRYIYLNRPGDCSPALPWNVGIYRSESDLIVQAGADIILDRQALELFYQYHQDSNGQSYIFGQCYCVHSPMMNALLDCIVEVPWHKNLHVLEEVLIGPYHHSSYWRVPMLASLPKACFAAIRGYDESFVARTWPDDADCWVRLEATGVQAVNVPDIWGAHQYHPQTDPVCAPGCECPLWQKSGTYPHEGATYQGRPEDIVRNLDHWGEYPDLYED